MKSDLLVSFFRFIQWAKAVIISLLSLFFSCIQWAKAVIISLLSLFFSCIQWAKAHCPLRRLEEKRNRGQNALAFCNSLKEEKRNRKENLAFYSKISNFIIFLLFFPYYFPLIQWAKAFIISLFFSCIQWAKAHYLLRKLREKRNCGQNALAFGNNLIVINIPNTYNNNFKEL